MATKAQKTALATAVIEAMQDFRTEYNKPWDFGMNWNTNTMLPDLVTFFHNNLFPKLNETEIISIALGNKYNWLAREVEFIGQLSEQYVVLDSVPVDMDLTKNAELLLKRNYPRIATKLYGPGLLKKQKFTLNNNALRTNFSTLGDLIGYALEVYRKKIYDINNQEEREMTAMILDYSLRLTKDTRAVSSTTELIDTLYEIVLNLQSSSEDYNETDTASGGEIGRYTVVSDLNDLVILTTDKVKKQMLNTEIANTFQVAGLDLTDHIISFPKLGGVYRTTADITITAPATIAYFQSFGDYQIEVGDIIPKDHVITFKVDQLTEFTGNVEEIAPPDPELYGYVFDVNKIIYDRDTNGMLKEPFTNSEFDEVTWFIHYYSKKHMNPWYNNALAYGGVLPRA